MRTSESPRGVQLQWDAWAYANEPFFPFCKDKDHTVHQIADQNVPGGNKSHNFDPYHKSLLKHLFSAWLPYFPLTPSSSLSLFVLAFAFDCIWLPTALGISLCAQPSKTLTIRCWSKRKRINLNLLVQGLLPLLLQDNTKYFNEYYLQNHAIRVLLVWCFVWNMNERFECKLTSFEVSDLSKMMSLAACHILHKGWWDVTSV